ncbi:MAG: hypothetical protein FWF75_00025 [Propionibacteriaceae bacterium]|nr:hypothetical protein [Propionibacteriaceae bacterium]
MSTSDIVEAFASDLARAVGDAAARVPALWGAQVGVVFPRGAAPDPERIWVFPVAREDAEAGLDGPEPTAAIAELDAAVSRLVIALHADLGAAGSARPTGLRAQVDASDGAADLDFSYDEPDVDPLDSDDVGDWVGELFD